MQLQAHQAANTGPFTLAHAASTYHPIIQAKLQRPQPPNVDKKMSLTCSHCQLRSYDKGAVKACLQQGFASNGAGAT